MDDAMHLLTEQRRRLALARPEELAPAWNRLAAELAGPSPARAPSPRRILGVRRGWALAGLTATAAVLISALIVTVPEITGGSVPPARAQAAQILNSAAEAALAAPFVEPRPDQFLYTKITFAGGGEEIWSSVDGTHDGLMTTATSSSAIPGCRNGRRAAFRGDEPIGSEDCVPEPGYRPELPTDTDAMYAYLLAQAGGDPSSRANSLGKLIFALSAEYLRPATRAALFRAAARLPGLTVISDATDQEGRHGVGIGWTLYGDQILFVFDPQSFTRIDRQSSLVDRAGERP